MTDDLVPSIGIGHADASDEFDRLLIRYFSGQMHGDDRRRLDRWLAETPDRTQELERMRHLWLRSAVEPMEVQVEAALARFKDRAHRDDVAVLSASKVRPVLVASGRRLPWLALAAGMVMAIGAGLWWYARPWGPGVVANASAQRLYATARGQRITVRLADGTDVVLAPSSMLEVSPTFGADSRDVRLTGLAFFAVAKDSSRPFRVRGSDGLVQVLGTKFAARMGRERETPIEVVVSEGRVALRGADSPDRMSAGDSVLTHGDLGYVAADGTVKVMHGVDLSDRLGWVEGRLHFDQTPLPVVLRELETWFGVDFVIASPALRHAELTATFDHDSPVDMLRVLEAALGVKGDIKGNVVTLNLSGHAH